VYNELIPVCESLHSRITTAPKKGAHKLEASPEPWKVRGWLWLRCSLEANSIMTYRERLYRWAIMRLLPTHQWVVVGRYYSISDADGHVQFLRRQLPNVQFKVVFELKDG
jgi:hypothetical protein